MQLVLKKVLPDLQATELTGKDGERLIPGNEPPPDTRQIGRAILATLSEAVPESVGEFPQCPRETKDTNGEVGGSDTSPEASGAGLLAPDAHSQAGEWEAIGDGGEFIRFLSHDGNGREKWAIHNAASEQVCAMWDRAEARRGCQQLIAEGKITR